VIGLDALVRLVDAGTTGDLTLDALRTSGLARAKGRVKILGGAS